MRLTRILLFVLAVFPMVRMGSAETSHAVIRLYPGVAPGSEGWTQKEVREREPRLGGEIVRNVVDPTVTVFLPAEGTANGTGIVVCPGGGFEFLSWTNEGTAVASWLNKLGITVFLLKYRTADTGATEQEFQKSIMDLFMGLTTDFKGMGVKLAPAAALAVQDGRRAMEVVRGEAAKYGVAPERLGIMGFSAGATVALDSTLGYSEAGRPSFTASIYGTGPGGRVVPKDAPALFLVCASDDNIVPPISSAEAYTAWKSSGHLAELHIFEKGGHGFGMTKKGLPVDGWTDLFARWLGDQGLLGVKR